MPQEESEMAEDQRGRVVVYSGLGWGTGWLFTIGFAHLSFWKSVIALFIWPFIFGDRLAP